MASGKGFAARIVNTDIIHSRIHQGTFFSRDINDAALGAGAFLAALIQAGPNMSPHLRFIARVGGNCQLRLYEGPTWSVAGTPQAPFNRNRRSAIVPAMVLTSGPTVSVKGTELLSELIPGGIGASSGATSNAFEEWILDVDTDYLVEVENLTGQVQPINMQIDFYEAPKGFGII